MTLEQQSSIIMHQANRKAEIADVRLLLIRVDENVRWPMTNNGLVLLAIQTSAKLLPILQKNVGIGAQIALAVSTLFSPLKLTSAGSRTISVDPEHPSPHSNLLVLWEAMDRVKEQTWARSHTRPLQTVTLHAEPIQHASTTLRVLEMGTSVLSKQGNPRW
jgi:hypothetical protein